VRPRPPRISELRAAWWAYRCLRDVRMCLAAGRAEVRVGPPALPLAAVRGVDTLLGRARPTCLEAALVRQRWLSAHGLRWDVVIGVTAPRDGFRAHAWLEDSSQSTTPRTASAARQPWHELRRLKA
jgi:Transglutaminase-like superfamily